MNHFIKVAHAAFGAAAVVFGFAFPFILFYLAFHGYIIAALALLIFVPSFVSLLIEQYR